MSQFIYHTGLMYAKGPGNATPQQFGTLQSGSVDLSNTTKELFGQNSYPVAVGKGNGKITGKASSAAIQARFFNDIFFAGSGTLSAGQTLVAYGEPGTIPSSTAYTVTVSNSATYVEDWGVTYTQTGEPLIKVASAPTVGQYSVAEGVYTFAAADAGKAVQISYTWTSTTQGQTLAVTNTPVGAAATFSLLLSGQYNGTQSTLKLYACVSSKLSLATKQNDFAIPAFEFSAYADPSGRVLDWYNADAAA